MLVVAGIILLGPRTAQATTVNWDDGGGDSDEDGNNNDTDDKDDEDDDYRVVEFRVLDDEELCGSARRAGTAGNLVSGIALALVPEDLVDALLVVDLTLLAVVISLSTM